MVHQDQAIAIPGKLPGALTTERFTQLCQERNLVPLEITDHDVIQSITIRHNVMSGTFDWRVDKIGEQAIGLLVDVMADMWQYFFKQSLRPKLTSGHARVVIDQDGDSLKIIYGLIDPEHPDQPIPDALVAKSMLASALFGLYEKTAGKNFDPMAALTGIQIVDDVR